MRKHRVAMSVVALALLLVCVSSPQATAATNTTITLLNPPQDGFLELAVGESYTFQVHIESDEPFVLAMAMADQYYPGRGIYWHGGDRVTRATSADLALTMTGKKSTAELAAACDWPEPGTCWHEGVAPAAIVVGVRYRGGQVVVQEFAFAVKVP